MKGFSATVVWDQVFLDGDLIEDTRDWYLQDNDGNVWYVGEDSKDMENGEVVSTEGSWEWGRDDALPGIIMWADPSAHIGESYRQEYYEDEAEDWGKVLATNQSVKVPAGEFDNCIKTEDWSGLEPGSEYKYYCHGVGLVLETPAGSATPRTELVKKGSEEVAE